MTYLKSSEHSLTDSPSEIEIPNCVKFVKDSAN